MIRRRVLCQYHYLYQEQNGAELALDNDPSEYDCLMLGLTHGQGFSEVLKLMKFSNVLVVGENEVDVMQLPLKGGTDGFVYL